jgi:hypothetical protein
LDACQPSRDSPGPQVLGNDALTYLKVSLLARVGQSFYCQANNALTKLLIPLLASVEAGFYIYRNINITSLSAPVLKTVSYFYVRATAAARPPSLHRIGPKRLCLLALILEPLSDYRAAGATAQNMQGGRCPFPLAPL